MKKKIPNSNKKSKTDLDKLHIKTPNFFKGQWKNQICIYLAQLDSRGRSSEIAAAELRKRRAAGRAGGSPWPAAEGGLLRPGMFRTEAAVDGHGHGGADSSPFSLHSWLNLIDLLSSLSIRADSVCGLLERLNL